MEGILKSLVDAGPWGVLCAVLLLACAALWVAYRSSQAALFEEVRRSADALALSTAALRDNTEGRKHGMEAIAAATQLIHSLIARFEVLSAEVKAEIRSIEAVPIDSPPRRRRGD